MLVVKYLTYAYLEFNKKFQTLSNRIVFHWSAMLSGLGRTGENLAAQRISRRRTAVSVL
jgi:hypothetical protein